MGYSTRELPARAYGDGPVQEPEHPKYHAPSDDDIQVEDRLMLMILHDYELERCEGRRMRIRGWILVKEHEPEDDDDDDDTDDEDAEPTKDKEEEEHPAPADFSVVPVVDPVPLARDTEAFKTDEARKTIGLEPPMSASMEACIAEHAVAPIPPTNPAYDQALLGHRAAMIRMRDDIPEEDMLPQRKDTGFDSLVWSRCIGLCLLLDRAEDVGYVRALQASEHRMMTSIEEVNLRNHACKDKEQRAMILNPFKLLIDSSGNQRKTLTHTSRMMQDTHSGGDLEGTCANLPCMFPITDFMKCQPLNFKGTEGVVGLSQWLKKMESVFYISGCAIDNQVKFSTCTLLGAALNWRNGHMRTLGHDAAYVMTWGTLKKKLTDKYCPKDEIKKLEIKLWNLKFLADETEKVDKYISGLPDNIHGNVMSARPKTLDDAIELANDLMDQKLRKYAKRQNENKRKGCGFIKKHHNNTPQEAKL
ncbi:hypothetical protein Tco_0092990 [Tanacetum coccineum]